MKIAVYGGCFNPPHNVHINIIKYILDKGIVDKVFVVPAGNCYSKSGLVDLGHRVNMLKLCLDGVDNVSVEDIESDTNPMYTYMLLDHFKRLYPGSEIKFVMGSDNLKEISTWTNPEYLMKTYKFIVVLRDEDDECSLKKYDPYDSVEFIKNQGNISSTSVWTGFQYEAYYGFGP